MMSTITSIEASSKAEGSSTLWSALADSIDPLQCRSKTHSVTVARNVLAPSFGLRHPSQS